MTRASTSVFLLLCALASVSIALAAYCVDLTSGRTSDLPGDSNEVTWTTKPRANGRRCDLKGVLKITPPSWAKSVSFYMKFENSRVWSFDIGDSPTNNGWGGDAGSTRYDCEIHSQGKNLLLYRSDAGYPAPQLLKLWKNVIKEAILIRLSRMKLCATDYKGFSYNSSHGGLFAFDTMYMGLNKVVYGRLTGQGLCSVCIDFQSDSL